MGTEVELKLLTDASAARGIVLRQGAGRVKHLVVETPWIQERASKDDLSIEKVPRPIIWFGLLNHN